MTDIKSPHCDYAELHVVSNFSFLRGASRPEELVQRAAELGYKAIAITDECSYAGIVKAHVVAKNIDIKLIIGSEFYIDDSPSPKAKPVHLVLLAQDHSAYTEISALISRARRRSEKGAYQLSLDDLKFGTQHCLAIWLPYREQLIEQEAGQQLAKYFKQRLWLGVTLLQQHDDQEYFFYCQQLAQAITTKLVACNNIHMHDKDRKPLQDVLTAILHNTPVQSLGTRCMANGECYLKDISDLQSIYPIELLQESVRIAELCHFNLTQLNYEYPEELVPKHKTPGNHLSQLVWQGTAKRWPNSLPLHIKKQIQKELDIIAELKYEHYFLTVHDIVQFARQQKILCQGRGSAANSVVCYCLFITEVDPEQSSLLFERFISRERNEPPDIDVDFEHERREEVIQYIYNKYSRKRAALAATVITYRRRSAIRDVGRALGFDEQLIVKLAKSLAWWDKTEHLVQLLKNTGLDHHGKLAKQFIFLVNSILGFPRHLSQHVGGFIINRNPISTLVPIENAAMPDRTIVQWDKTDIEALGLLKVDVLSLGMLTAIRKTFDLVNGYVKHPIGMSDIPKEDPKTYDMLCRGDSIGVFQVESRAQMSMLPRLQPRTYYDLVIEIAIVRPGPIQGDMVHPYLRRRNGEEKVEYFNNDLKKVLERTLGIPIFQEQVIQIAMVAANFSGGEADALRRAMATWGKNGDLSQFKEKLIQGMLKNNYDQEFAERIFRQMRGFGEYGFPESHSASFALLAYVSAWLKCHYPAAFYCALLNSLPMGFYSASQLIQDAQRHGVDMLPVDVMISDWDHDLYIEKNSPVLENQPSIRMGMRLVKGFNEIAAQRIVSAREQSPFHNGYELRHRAQLNQQELNSLVNADALLSLSGHRYQAHWDTQSIASPTPLLKANDFDKDSAIEFLAPSATATTMMDYSSTGLTLNSHPMMLLRNKSPFHQCRRAEDLFHLNSGRFVRIAGLVTGRQRPGSASGVIFMTLEDETGNTNIIIWQDLQQRFRKSVLAGKLLVIKGIMECKHEVIHVIAGEIIDYSEQLNELTLGSRDFH